MISIVIFGFLALVAFGCLIFKTYDIAATIWREASGTATPILPCPNCRGDIIAVLPVRDAVPLNSDSFELWSGQCQSCHYIGPPMSDRRSAERAWNALPRMSLP